MESQDDTESDTSSDQLSDGEKLNGNPFASRAAGEEKRAPGARPQQEFTMVGVKVLFPVKPYPSQMAVMAQILRGLQKSENCLLESPTGSGKSLALLCSTLAWLRQHNERVSQFNALVDQGITDPELLERLTGLKPQLRKHPGNHLSGNSGPHTPAVGTRAGAAAAPRDGEALTSEVLYADGGDPAIASPTRSFSNASPQNRQPANGAEFVADGDQLDGGFIRDDDGETSAASAYVAQAVQPPAGALPAGPNFADTTGPTTGDTQPTIKKMRTCQVYFGSRTHKQIAQVVRELKRTAYADAKTAVLGSRDHYCIHPQVRKLHEKNEKCKDLRTGKGEQTCRYYHNASRIKRHDQLQNMTGIKGAHEIEELVRAGHSSHSCPYYIARQLASESAEIVFCPYNYLVDPLIRDAMEINLRGHVVVLDEAHNIEDCSREAASCQLLIDDMCDAMNDVETVGERANKRTEGHALALFLSILSGWMAKNSQQLEDSFEFAKNSKIFLGSSMIQILNELEIGRKQWVSIKDCLTELTAEPEDMVDPPKLKSSTLMLLRSLFLMYHFLFLRPVADADDYRIAVSKVQAKRKVSTSDETNTWLPRNRRNNTARLSWTVSLNFMCLNPGVAFSEVGKVTRSIILTSGTLSPMTSFQSELAVPFSVQLEANHVIDSKQVWVGTVGSGPNSLPLQATYRNTESPHFQDELGCLLISVCRTVPRGVLCFLPSYALLDKLVSRWQESGVWAGLSKKKEVLLEPRRSEEFEKTISLFYKTIKNTSSPPEPGETRDGALLLAVCRGKVSEGLDFTDDNARAVVAVGIPFPSFKDAQVSLKREYNDRHYRSRGLLSGSAWYEIQAYRALNQALGRCLRHRYDWGALLLVDVRFQQRESYGPRQELQHNRYIRSLSKWVRSLVVHHDSFREALSSMSRFAEQMSSNPPCPALSPVKDEPRNSSSKTRKHKASFATPSTHSAQPDVCPEVATSENFGGTQLDLNTGGGPMTSTQVDNQKSNRTDKDQLIFSLPSELSQITPCETYNPNRFLEDTDLELRECPSPIIPSRGPYSNLDGSPKPVAGPSFISALELSRSIRSGDTVLPDISSPSTNLASIFNSKLHASSPLATNDANRKRKLDSPNRKSPAKKEYIPSTGSTSRFATLGSPKMKYKFASTEKIRSLSPSIVTPTNHKKQEICVLLTPEKRIFETHQISEPSSPDLFNSSGELIRVESNRLRDASPQIQQTGADETTKKVPLSRRPIKPPPCVVISDDSDMDDFDLNKSIRRNPEPERSSVPPAPSRKGVVFSRFSDSR